MEENERVESYLVEVVNRLMDTQMVLESIQVTTNYEKQGLIKEGKSFIYQQAMIDLAREIHRYATGIEDLKTVMAEIKEQMKSNNKKAKDPMDVI